MSVTYDLGLVVGKTAKWHSGTAISGPGTGIYANVDGCVVGDMYLNTETKDVYRASALNRWDYVCVLQGKEGPMGPQGEMLVTVNSAAIPQLGELVCNTEYRCVNSALTSAPAFTVPAMNGNTAVFQAAVVFSAPNGTEPQITNNSGYPLKYSGKNVAEGVFTPQVGRVYRLSLVFDGINLNCYVTGV